MTPLEKIQFFIGIPIVILLAMAEGLILSRREHYDWRAFGVSITDVVLRASGNILLPLSIVTPLTALAYEYRLTTIALDGWLAFLLLFIGQDFCYYWYHRAAHRVRWFWANHSVHHSSNQLNLAAALRIGLFGRMSGTLVFFVPLIWFGFDPRIVLTTLALNLLYQFWLHATWIPKLGWLEGVVNTPSAHRVHHAANLDYLDANYGGVLLVFDRMFGTYRPERDDLPCRYGLVEPLLTNNLLRIEFTQWIALGRDLLSVRSPRALFGYLFMPPGWSPHGEGKTTAELRARHQRAQEASAMRTSAAGAEAEPRTLPNATVG